MEKAARIAAEGIGGDIAPALAALIERLGDADVGIRQQLELLSVSLGRVEGVLKEATEEALAEDLRRQQQQHQPQQPQQHSPSAQPQQPRQPPASYDISSDAMEEEDGCVGDVGDDGIENAESRRKTRRVDDHGGATATAPTRWTKPAANAPWTRAASSAAARDEARRALQAMGCAATAGVGAAMDPSRTNDLATAERLAREAALRQQEVALQQQQLLREDPALARVEEQQRHQREQRCAEELRKHQAAAEQAAAAAASEEARRKQELWDSMPPEQRAQAARLHEQQAAVGAHVFGTEAASRVVELVQQQQASGSAQGQAGGEAHWDEAEVERLMAMSAEELVRWDQEQQSLL